MTRDFYHISYHEEKMATFLFFFSLWREAHIAKKTAT